MWEGAGEGIDGGIGARGVLRGEEPQPRVLTARARQTGREAGRGRGPGRGRGWGRVVAEDQLAKAWVRGGRRRGDSGPRPGGPLQKFAIGSSGAESG